MRSMSACLDCGCHGGDHFAHCPRKGEERLAVNINAECADTLRRIKAARGITTTEAVRRAISLLDYFERRPVEMLPCLAAECGSDAVIGGWCGDHQ